MRTQNKALSLDTKWTFFNTVAGPDSCSYFSIIIKTLHGVTRNRGAVSYLQNSTVRYGSMRILVFDYPAVWCGAVLSKLKLHDAVWFVKNR